MASLNRSAEEILVIGAAGLDVVGRVTKSSDPGTSSPAKIRVCYGGVARNVAENLVHLGQTVSLMTVVGNDDTGKQILKHMRGQHVNVECTKTTDHYSTGVYMAMLTSTGEREHAISDREIMTDLTAEFIKSKSECFDRAAFIFIDANLPPTTIQTIIRLARKYHIPVCADPTSNALAVRLQPYLKDLEIVICNHIEAAELCGMDSKINNPEANRLAARKLTQMGVGSAVISLGEMGFSYATSETSGHIPAIVTSVLDPTGAGDAFTAAVIYGYLNGLSMDDGLRLGASAASLTLRYPGSVLPDLSVEKLYANLII